MSPVVRQADHLSHDEVDDVHHLATAAGDADGAYPLSEHVMLHLRLGGDAPAVHLLIRHGDTNSSAMPIWTPRTSSKVRARNWSYTRCFGVMASAVRLSRP